MIHLDNCTQYNKPRSSPIILATADPICPDDLAGLVKHGPVPEREPIRLVGRKKSHAVALPQSDAQQADLAQEKYRLLLQERGRGLARLGRGPERGEGWGQAQAQGGWQTNRGRGLAGEATRGTEAGGKGRAYLALR